MYRDFAEQLPDRSYGPGPLLRAADPADAPLALLRRIGPTHLRLLADRTGESANLVVRVGAEARFVCTVEAGRVLRVGDRTGKSLPAELTSGGRALLAAAPLDELARLYGSNIDALLPRLARVRNDGYAVNRNETEDRVTAVGTAVGSPPVCAVSVSLPTVRFDERRLPDLVAALRETAEDLAHALATDLAVG